MSMDEPTTQWSIATPRDGNATYQILRNGKPFMIKGVCYAPAPINANPSKEPALGDFFWDTFQAGGDTIYNWYSLWGYGSLGNGFYARNDLAQIKGFGCNALRIYACLPYQMNENGTLPSTMEGRHHFTHKQFLDLCAENGISVMVDIPMPISAYQKYTPWVINGQYFWETNLDQITKDIGNHPAVLGFNIMNEVDQDKAAFPQKGSGNADENTDYFYGQSVKYAQIVKKNAPDKLVGWALHDVPQLLYFAQRNTPTTGGKKTYLELLSDVFDYWGINTYQYKDLSSIFSPTIKIENGLSYDQLPEGCKKPVIFTEFGWPATSHQPKTTTGQIYADDTTLAATAKLVSEMYGMAYTNPAYNFMFGGAFYFEFADEWWKSDDPAAWNGGDKRNDGFPGGFQDEEGFGLNAIKRGEKRKNTDPNWVGNGPVLPQDVYMPRMPIINALKAVFDKS